MSASFVMALPMARHAMPACPAFTTLGGFAFYGLSVTDCRQFAVAAGMCALNPFLLLLWAERLPRWGWGKPELALPFPDVAMAQSGIGDAAPQSEEQGRNDQGARLCFFFAFFCCSWDLIPTKKNIQKTI